MVPKPELSIAAGEPQGDFLGQFWSPAKVTMRWPAAGPLSGPSIEVSVVAAIRGQMTVDELRKAHVQAAHDVLSAALLSLEKIPETARTKQKSRQR